MRPLPFFDNDNSPYDSFARADLLAVARREVDVLVRERVAALDEDQRRTLREALDKLAVA